MKKSDRDVIADALATSITASVANLDNRCACGALQPDDVRWAVYGIEVENTKTGEMQTGEVRLCPACELRMDNNFK